MRIAGISNSIALDELYKGFGKKENQQIPPTWVDWEALRRKLPSIPFGNGMYIFLLTMRHGSQSWFVTYFDQGKANSL